MLRLIGILALFGWFGSSAFAQDWPSNQFRASYYNNATLSGSVVYTNLVSRVQFSWGTGSPRSNIQSNNFSARYRGSFSFTDQTWIFRARADDGFRLYIDDRLVLDGWSSAGVVQEEMVYLTAGSHRIELQYREITGSASVELSWRSYNPTLVCSLPTNGWCAEAYTNRTLSGTPSLAAPPTGTPQLDVSLPVGSSSARIRGRYEFQEGIYDLTLTSRDGVRLWINGVLLVNDWKTQARKTHSLPVALTAGSYEVRLEHYRTGGAENVVLNWELQAPEPAGGFLGTNITALDYWASEWTLLDFFKPSGGWYTQVGFTWDTLEQSLLDLDPNGWVRSLPASNDSTRRFRTVAALAVNGLSGHYPAGRYIVLYEGEGTLTYGNDAVYNAALSTPGRHVLDVATPTNNGILIKILATNPANYIRNISLVQDGYLCTEHPYEVCTNKGCGGTCTSIESSFRQNRFHPAFLRDLQGMSVLRYMDFLATNTSTLSNWTHRPRLEHARWNSSNGAPMELIAELSNKTGTDPWVNVPTRATNDFVRQMAQLFLTQLDPNRKIYVEYSNELWNTSFPNGSWVETQAVAMWPTSPLSPFTRRVNYTGLRASQIVGIFKEVFGAQADRVIGVMAGQASNSWVAQQLLDCPLATADGATPCWQNMDAVALAPYFGYYLGLSRLRTTLAPWLTLPDRGIDNLFAELTTGVLYDPNNPNNAPLGGALAQASQQTQAHATIAASKGLELLAYEGGQHLVGVGSEMENAALNELFWAANRDPRMGEIYTEYLQTWLDNGGGKFCHFLSVQSYNRFGSWGAKEYQDQTSTPKFDALQSFID